MNKIARFDTHVVVGMLIGGAFLFSLWILFGPPHHGDVVTFDNGYMIVMGGMVFGGLSGSLVHSIRRIVVARAAAKEARQDASRKP
jgi:hypothetical protein